MKEERPGAEYPEARSVGKDFLGRRDFTDCAPKLQDEEIASVRRIWWSLRRNGSQVPAERGLILIDGGLS